MSDRVNRGGGAAGLWGRVQAASVIRAVMATVAALPTWAFLLAGGIGAALSVLAAAGNGWILAPLGGLAVLVGLMSTVAARLAIGAARAKLADFAAPSDRIEHEMARSAGRAQAAGSWLTIGLCLLLAAGAHIGLRALWPVHVVAVPLLAVAAYHMLWLPARARRGEAAIALAIPAPSRPTAPLAQTIRNAADARAADKSRLRRLPMLGDAAFEAREIANMVGNPHAPRPLSMPSPVMREWAEAPRRLRAVAGGWVLWLPFALPALLVVWLLPPSTLPTLPAPSALADLVRQSPPPESPPPSPEDAEEPEQPQSPPAPEDGLDDATGEDQDTVEPTSPETAPTDPANPGQAPRQDDQGPVQETAPADGTDGSAPPPGDPAQGAEPGGEGASPGTDQQAAQPERPGTDGQAPAQDGNGENRPTGSPEGNGNGPEGQEGTTSETPGEPLQQDDGAGDQSAPGTGRDPAPGTGEAAPNPQGVGETGPTAQQDAEGSGGTSPDETRHNPPGESPGDDPVAQQGGDTALPAQPPNNAPPSSGEDSAQDGPQEEGGPAGEPDSRAGQQGNPQQSEDGTTGAQPDGPPSGEGPPQGNARGEGEDPRPQGTGDEPPSGEEGEQGGPPNEGTVAAGGPSREGQQAPPQQSGDDTTAAQPDEIPSNDDRPQDGAQGGAEPEPQREGGETGPLEPGDPATGETGREDRQEPPGAAPGDPAEPQSGEDPAGGTPQPAAQGEAETAQPPGAGDERSPGEDGEQGGAEETGNPANEDTEAQEQNLSPAETPGSPPGGPGTDGSDILPGGSDPARPAPPAGGEAQPGGGPFPDGEATGVALPEDEAAPGDEAGPMGVAGSGTRAPEDGEDIEVQVGRPGGGGAGEDGAPPGQQRLPQSPDGTEGQMEEATAAQTETPEPPAGARDLDSLNAALAEVAARPDAVAPLGEDAAPQGNRQQFAAPGSIGDTVILPTERPAVLPTDPGPPPTQPLPAWIQSLTGTGQ